MNLTATDRAIAAGIAQAADPAFVVAGETFTLADMLAVNADDAATCAWLATAKPGEVLEQFHGERVQCVPVAPQKRQYVVTVIRGGHHHEWTEAYASQHAAQDAGLEFLGTFHGVATARPLVELTEDEGARRFPHPLHKDAFTDAWRGWHERAARDFQPEPSDAARMLHDYDYALVAQMQANPQHWI